MFSFQLLKVYKGLEGLYKIIEDVADEKKPENIIISYFKSELMSFSL